MQLVKRYTFTNIAISKAITIRHYHLIGVRLFQSFTTEELNTFIECLLNNDVLFVSPCCSESHHLITSCITTLIEWQRLQQVSMSYFFTYGSNVLSQLHIGFLTIKDSLESYPGFLYEQDCLFKVSHFNE